MRRTEQNNIEYHLKKLTLKEHTLNFRLKHFTVIRLDATIKIIHTIAKNKANKEHYGKICNTPLRT